MSASAEPASHYVDLRGLRFRYLDWGNADEAPLIRPHGAGG